MPNLKGEPEDEGARYAFGYTDKKPSLSHWIAVGIIVAGAVWSFLSAIHGRFPL